MTQRGELFGEAPQACPFIALELDRDRRSDKPDYRHRCYAEPTPQPRAIAHQERYCLSADFAACPIFQGWAMRAAARPVPVPQGYEGRAKADQPSVDQPPRASAQPVLPPDVPLVVPLPGEAWPADAFAPPVAPDAPSQMPAFDAAADDIPAPPAVPTVPAMPFMQDEPDPPSAWSSSSARLADSSDASDEPPMPSFLAGRTERPVSQRPRASRPDLPYKETVTREDLVPSWEITDRYGAEVSEHRARDGSGGDDGGGDRFGGMITAIAVVAILAVGVLGVIFLPGLLAGKGPAATATPTFSTAVPTGLLSPSLPPVATATAQITAVPTAEVTPTPEATPRLYRIKASDNSLTQIAHRFGITLRELLDANPQITDPNHIEVGQVITIPQPVPTPTPLST
ncbi:MAG: LysM peptidoglycan-binding domain-containing protein [Chloroflexota bacterium]|nr:LysM peptidoglycan-binding domain-containing protein [Chloroflexota bacterium]